MANHFHLVCEVPDPRPLSQSEVLERIGALYGRRRVRGLKKKLAQIAAEYRKHLFLRGTVGSKNHSPAFDQAKAQAVVEQEEGELSLQERLRCKIRYFTDGVILGSGEFVQSHCQQLKQKIGYKRKSGPTALKIFGPTTLWVFRNLRVPQIRVGTLRFPGPLFTHQHGTDASKRVGALARLPSIGSRTSTSFSKIYSTVASSPLTGGSRCLRPII